MHINVRILLCCAHAMPKRLAETNTCPTAKVNTDCTTYKDCGYDKKEKDKIKQKATRLNICVDCKADCLFNEQHYCKANGISIMTNNNRPECSTFLPK